MTLWMLFAAMSLVAVAFVALPLYRRDKRLSPLLALTIVLVAALPAGLYYKQGQPGVPSGAAASPAMDEVVESLAARLEANLEDVSGWKMLGRSYLALGNPQAAVDAFEQANALEGGSDAQTLVSLGEAYLAASQGPVAGEVSALFESALAIDPNNQRALFYGGIAAFNRNDQALAANRWERLLSLNPPPEIESILRQRIAEWRGEPVAAAGAAADATGQPAEPETAPPGTVVSVSLSLSDAAASGAAPNTGVFIIARDPAQPSPPIAVSRRLVRELPTVVHLGDRESMVPGRDLSGFEQFEVVARVSMSGQPSQQSGDWYGAVVVRPAVNNTIDLTISERVP